MEAPLCGTCLIPMTCKKTGIFVLVPKQLNYGRNGDMFGCSGCDATVITNFAQCYHNDHADGALQQVK